MPRRTRTTDRALEELRAYALTFPGAHTRSPWPGHLDAAVDGKTFAWLPVEGDPFHVGCKLPTSRDAALMLPFAKPAAYGLGKSGWVNAEIADGEAVPVAMLKAWIAESYRALASKKRLKELDARGQVEAPAAAPSAKRPAARKAAAKAAKRRR